MFSFALITWGQNESERQKIIQNSNIKVLKQLEEFYRNKSITDKKKALEFAQQKGFQIFQTLPDGRIAELQRIHGDGTPIYYITQSNLGAANTTKASRLWTGGSMGLNLNGQGMIVGEWDGGPIRLTHQEFGTRAIQQDGVAFTTSDLNNRHATHVGGTMIASGVDGNAKGMAHQATLWANEWNNDTAEMTAQATQGLILSNHSYGYNSAALPTWMFGFYDSEAQAWDQIASNAPFYLMVKAAGNDRGDGYNPGGVFGTTGYNLLTGSATAKNVLVVGAVNAVSNYTGPASVVMSGFSSWGPTDDGRIKPDVVGNGVNIYSTTSTGNTNYESMSGTSMASPNVTGTLTLIQQHYKNLNSGSFMRAATLRGLVIHTADEAGANPGPDYAFGWGLVNAEKAVNAITNRNVSSVIEERTLNNSTPYTFNVTAINSSIPLEVTIVWNDPAATPLADGTSNSTQSMLINDLDLRITEGANTYLPWVLNPATPTAAATQADNARDNVEKIIINNPVAGATYTVTINHKGTLQGSNPQNYSIIATGVTTNPNAVFADFTMNQTTICLGQTITFTDASVKLPSAANINSWTWNFDGTSVGGATPSTATTQGPHTITFNQSGTYQISLTVSNGSATNTKTQTITVRPVNNLPLTEGFENSPVVGWTTANSGGSFNWGVSNTVGQASTRSATVNLFTNNIGTNALFLNAPPVNLQGYASVDFAFQLAYTGYNPVSPVYATLEVQASTDCGQTYNTVWIKSGAALSTTTPPARTFDFTAPTVNEWRQETFNLNSLIGNNSVLLRFRLTDNYSNRIYVDNINITGVLAPPTAPTTLTATAVSSSQINLSWTDNANNETAYKVERSPDGINGWTEIAGNLPANTNSYSDNGLTANTTYHYRVRASNAGGNSAYSNVANATTLSNAPSVPTTLTATTVSSSQINLSWTDNANNETAYKVERSPDGVNGWTEIAGNLPANTNSYSDNGLTANTTYHYRVRAGNTGGNSAYSNVANATTLSNAPSVPTTPTTLTATAVSTSQINLSWADNANNETAYKVERSPDGVNGWTEIAGNLPANTATYSDNGLTANTTYHYRVRASNAGGNSAYSNVANAKTQEDATTAINPELDKAISVYPNPTQNHIQINLTKIQTSDTQITIYNSTGIIIKTLSSHDKLIYLTFDELPKGVYYIRIKTDNGTSLKKIVLN
ncbi:MAG: fibronectin type III domain-containing protein [Raineya sp.]|nr:fibronectin type III domain-containing protein [Raineya sp.]